MARTSSADAGAPKEPKPKKVRWYHQIWQAYQITQRFDPRTRWILIGITVGVTAVFAAVGALVTDAFWYWGLMGLSFGLVGAVYYLTRRVEVAAYAGIEGQPGATHSALSTLRGGWIVADEPVAMEARHQDMVFRAVGRPGVVLISEGPTHRVVKLLEAERKRTARVVSGAPIVLVQMGDGEGQVSLSKLTRHLGKMKKTLTKQEVETINKRLRSLGGMKLPIPKGVDPTRARPDRRGMRGR